MDLDKPTVDASQTVLDSSLTSLIGYPRSIPMDEDGLMVLEMESITSYHKHPASSFIKDMLVTGFGFRRTLILLIDTIGVTVFGTISKGIL